MLVQATNTLLFASVTMNGMDVLHQPAKNLHSRSHLAHSQVAASTLAVGSTKSIRHVESIPGCLQQIYHVVLSDGTQCLLKYPPSPGVKLSRQERQGLIDEPGNIGMLSSFPNTSTPEVLLHGQAVLGSCWSHLLLDTGRNVPLSNFWPLCGEDLVMVEDSLAIWINTLSSIESTFFGAVCLARDSFIAPSWRVVLWRMLEMALLDAGELSISLPYDQIRYQFRQHGRCLDDVSTPKLVILNALEMENIMIDPESMQVKGLIDYSLAIWGDPELLNFTLVSAKVGVCDKNPAVRDDTSRKLRHLLYQTYTATSAIVSRCLRPRSEEEMEARRLLTVALNELDKFSCD